MIDGLPTGGDEVEQPTHVHADDHSMAAGRDIYDIRDHARFAGRDYYESTDIREDDPEWERPEPGSGLIRCPSCKRRHIAVEAIACPRCGYPQREKAAAQHERYIHEAAEREGWRRLSGIAIGLPTLWFAMDGWGMSFGRALGFAALFAAAGYVFLPLAFERLRWWLDS